MRKNTASQKWRVFAFNVVTNQEVTGDAANITAKLSKDYGTATALTDTNPTETEDGFYLFDLTKAETNADDLAIYPESSTADVQVIGVPGSYSTDEVTASASTATASDGDVPFDLVGPAISVDEVVISNVPAEGAKAGTIQIELIIGDDYLSTNGRSLTWTVAIPAGTTVAGSTCTLTFVQASGACDPFDIEFYGTVATSGDDASLSFNMTAAETTTIPSGEYFWFVTWLGDAGEVITKVYNRQLVKWKSKGVA